MSVAIGRVSPVHLTNVAAVSRGRGSLKLGGRVATLDPALTSAVASQIDGLATDLDDPVIPVVFTGSHAGLAHLNGFYRVSDASFDIGPGEVDPADPVGYSEWGLTLDPVVDRAAPRIESILETVLRTNSAGVTTANADLWHSVPVSVPVYDDGVSQALFPDISNPIPTATGNVYIARDATNVPPLRRIVAWRCKPGDWYDGGATVERLWGTTWLPVIGRDLSISDPSVEGWGISNGLIRIRLDLTAASQFTIDVFTTGAWRNLCTAKLRVDASPPFGAARYLTPSGVSILRNHPAEVRIRITGNPTTTMPTSIADIRLRRGSPLLEMRWASPNSTLTIGVPYSIETTPNPTLTANGASSAWSAAADGNGNQIVRMTPEGSGSGTVNGNGDATFTTAIGFVRSGWPMTYAQLTDMYYAPSAEFVRFVGA